MTNTSSISSKLFVGFVATAMLFSLSFSPAKAATAADLQAQINALLAQVAALQGGTTGASTCPAFTMDLKMGSKGADVTALQNFLIAHNAPIAAGATGFFGGQTKSALMAFQTANSITPAKGFFGPKTRAAVNAMCTTTTTGGTTGGTTTGGTTTGGTTSLKGGEATLSQYQLRTGDKTDLQEGIKDAAVAVGEFKVKQGDLNVTRVDVTFDNSTVTNVKNPWEVFQTVAIMVGGDKVGSIDASDENNWTKVDTNTTQNHYRIRITGLNSVVRMDNLIDMTVAVSVQNGTDIPVGGIDNWKLMLGNSDANAIRGTDAAGVDQYIGDASKAVSFTVAKKGVDDELNIKSSSINPQSTTIKADANTTSDWVTILAYTLDTKNSINAINVRSLPIQVNVPGVNTYNDVVNNARLKVGSQTYSPDSVSNSGTAMATANFNFDKGVWVIKAGDTATVEFQVKLNRIANVSPVYPQGQTIIASTTDADNMTAEGVKTLTSSQTSGSAQGKTHTIRTSGVILAKNSMSTSLTQDPNVNTNNTGVFHVKFDVTAFENDVWINKTATQGVVATTSGVNYIVRDSSGVAVATGTATAALSATADTDGTQFKVNQGETKTFDLAVTFDPAGAAGQYFTVEVQGVNFATAANGTTNHQLALPLSDYQTSALSI